MNQKNRIALKPLQSGQIWKMVDEYLHVEEVGKLLVHYKLFRGEAKRARTSLSGKDVVSKYLEKNRAVLARKSSKLNPMKNKAVNLMLLSFCLFVFQGCVAFPPLVNVEHKE